MAVMFALGGDELAQAMHEDPTGFVGFIIAMRPYMSDASFLNQMMEAAEHEPPADDSILTMCHSLQLVFNREEQ